MDGLDHRGNPRRSMWACFYAAATVMGLLYITDREQAPSLASATDGIAAAGTSVKVSARYSREVILTDGTIIPVVIKNAAIPGDGIASFSVYESDSTLVDPDYQGFAIVVTATVLSGTGCGDSSTFRRTVKVTMASPDPVSLGSLPSSQGVPAQWTTVDEVVSDFDTRLDALEVSSLLSPSVKPNDLKATGTYTRTSGTGNLAIDGYPSDGWYGYFRVTYATDSYIVQEAIPGNGVAGGPLMRTWESPSSAWSPWKRLVTDDDTGWRRLASWSNGVQDVNGQVGTIDLANYELVGNGFLDIRRRGGFVFFRSEYAISGGGGLKTLGATQHALFTDYTLPFWWLANDGTDWGSKVPVGHRGVERLLLGSITSPSSFGLITPDGPVVIRSLTGGYPTTTTFPTEPYPGTPGTSA